jgi:MoaF N-terminal domain
MAQAKLAPAIRGKTIRLIWTEGPTKGSTYEHVFHEDGTVEWRGVDESSKTPAKAQPQTAPSTQERAEYAAVQVADNIYAVSYLAPSGYTLTVVLNFRDRRMIGFASGAKEWYPIGGTFEVV